MPLNATAGRTIAFPTWTTLTRDQAQEHARNLNKVRELLVRQCKAIDRKRSWRPSEKAMAKGRRRTPVVQRHQPFMTCCASTTASAATDLSHLGHVLALVGAATQHGESCGSAQRNWRHGQGVAAPTQLQQL